MKFKLSRYSRYITIEICTKKRCIIITYYGGLNITKQTINAT